MSKPLTQSYSRFTESDYMSNVKPERLTESELTPKVTPLIMPKFKIVNIDQGHEFEHIVRAISREEAINDFKAWHYGKVVECDEIKESLNEDTDENNRN